MYILLFQETNSVSIARCYCNSHLPLAIPPLTSSYCSFTPGLATYSSGSRVGVAYGPFGMRRICRLLLTAHMIATAARMRPSVRPIPRPICAGELRPSLGIDVAGDVLEAGIVGLQSAVDVDVETPIVAASTTPCFCWQHCVALSLGPWQHQLPSAH